MPESLDTYPDLLVWQKAVELVITTYTLTTCFPTDERFGLTSHMRRAAVSIPSNIAEGYERNHRGDYLRHLSIANGSLKEVETQIIVAGRLDMVTTEQAKEVWGLTQEVGILLRKLMVSLEPKS